MPERKHTLIDCDSEIRGKRGPDNFTAQDGDEWTCSCGRVFTHVEDEAEGSSWWYLPENQYVAAHCK
jgi:hypothetical protein